MWLMHRQIVFTVQFRGIHDISFGIDGDIFSGKFFGCWVIKTIRREELIINDPIHYTRFSRPGSSQEQNIQRFMLRPRSSL